MRTFIKLTFLFSIAFFALIIVITEVPESIVERYADFKLHKNSKYIVVGHSHSECAFNDSLIPELTNLSGSGEAYFYTYFKLKKILEQNPSIEVVFIEFSNNQVNKSMDDWIWDEEHINLRYPMFSAFMSLQDKSILASNNFKAFINANSLSTKANFNKILSANYSSLEYSKAESQINPNKIDSLVAESKKTKHILQSDGISETNLSYLSKCITLCEENGKRVILIRSPLHEYYTGYSNEKTYQLIHNQHYSEIEYLDFSKFPLENSEYFDLEHLNQKGASRFSKWFANQLNDVNLHPDKSRNFFEEK